MRAEPEKRRKLKISAPWYEPGLTKPYPHKLIRSQNRFYSAKKKARAEILHKSWLDWVRANERLFVPRWANPEQLAMAIIGQRARTPTGRHRKWRDLRWEHKNFRKTRQEKWADINFAEQKLPNEDCRWAWCMSGCETCDPESFEEAFWKMFAPEDPNLMAGAFSYGGTDAHELPPEE